MRVMPRFRADHGGVVVDLPDGEQEILLGVVSQLRDLLMMENQDPSLRRLKPPARPDDDTAEADYREMVDDQLLQGRLESIERVEECITGATLDEGDVGAWMHTLNSLRLILGERLSLEGADLESHDLGDGAAAALYLWIGGLLEELVTAANPSLATGED